MKSELSRRAIKRTVAFLLAAVVLAEAFMPAPAYVAGSTRLMKVYDSIKSDNYVYCATFDGIYKINIKTYRITRLAARGQGNEYLHALKKKGSYIYYMANGPIYTNLMRVKTFGSKAKKILDGFDTKALEGNAISKSKLYVTNGVGKERVMSLSGKSAKKTSVMI